MSEVIRIVMKKNGAASFCSHLDTMRTVQRLLRKANVPLWYSEGFHPHPRIVFAAPLPLGLEGERELLDVKLSQPTPEHVKEMLQKSFPETLEVVDCYLPKRSFNDIHSAAYRIILKHTESLEEMLCRPLPIAKRTKRGEKMIDVRDYIVKYEVNSASSAFTDFTVWLECNQEKNLNPSYLLDALCQYDAALCAKKITRLGFFDCDQLLFE